MQTPTKYFIYRTVNLNNGKYYLGMHSTSNIEDGYLGSGTLLKRAICKYGKTKFKREILEFLPNFESLIKRESEVITEEIVNDPNSYNLTIGGYGNFDYINKNCHNNKGNYRKVGNYGFKIRPVIDDDFRNKVSVGMKRFLENDENGFKGKTHSKEYKDKMSEIMKEKQKGIKNSQYGSFWITNGEKNSKSKGEIPEGYWRGRV